MPQGTSDRIDRKTHTDYSGYATVAAVWATHRANLLAARAALLAAGQNAINPSGAVELQHLIEDIDRNDTIYR